MVGLELTDADKSPPFKCMPLAADADAADVVGPGGVAHAEVASSSSSEYPKGFTGREGGGTGAAVETIVLLVVVVVAATDLVSETVVFAVVLEASAAHGDSSTRGGIFVRSTYSDGPLDIEDTCLCTVDRGGAAGTHSLALDSQYWYYHRTLLHATK